MTSRHARTGKVTSTMKATAVSRAISQKASKTVQIPPNSVRRSGATGRFVSKSSRTGRS